MSTLAFPNYKSSKSVPGEECGEVSHCKSAEIPGENKKAFTSESCEKNDFDS